MTTDRSERGEEATLRPCPFCGLSLMVVYNPANDESSITCSDSESCVAVSALGLKNLNRVWNTRPLEDRLTEENRRLREALNEAIQQCQCNLVQRASGHRVDCNAPEWLEAVGVQCGDCGDDGEPPNKNCPKCFGIGFLALRTEGGE